MGLTAGFESTKAKTRGTDIERGARMQLVPKSNGSELQRGADWTLVGWETVGRVEGTQEPTLRWLLEHDY